MLQGFSSDLQLAARRLAATPLFTIFAVLSLAAGVGVTTAVYSVVDSTLLKDLGIRHPHDVVFVMTPDAGRLVMDALSGEDFRILRSAQRSFSSIAASAAIHVGVASPARTEMLDGEAVDGGYFSTLGVRAVIGRTIQASDDRSGAQVVVLSHGLWQSRLASDPTIVGRTLRLAGRQFEVIGVAPESFEGPLGWFTGARLWVPLAAASSIGHLSASASVASARDTRRFMVVGRLRPDLTV